MEWMTAFWFAVAWLVGGFVNGITGFGAAMAAMPIVLLGMDLTLAAPACSLMALIASMEQYMRYRGHTDWSRAVPLLLGAFPGAVAGVLALRFLSPDYLQCFLGVFLLFYAVWGLFLEGAQRIVVDRSWGYVAGFFSGTLGSAFSFLGPPLAVYTTLTGWDKETSKAGLASFFVITCLVMIGAQIVAGLHNMITFSAMLVGAPFTVFGAYLGLKVSKGMSDETYRKLLFLFLGLCGIMFLWQSAVHLMG